MSEQEVTYSQIKHSINVQYYLIAGVAGFLALWTMASVELVKSLIVGGVFVVAQTMNAMCRNWRLHGAYRAEQKRLREKKVQELEAAFAEKAARDAAQPQVAAPRRAFALDD